MAVSLGELAVRFGCELRGDPDTAIEHVATLAHADARSLAFLANPRYRGQLAETRAAAVVLNVASAAGCRTAMLVCDNPYATYARIATLLYPAAPPVPGVHASAVVARGAHIDPSVEVCAGAIVAPGVVIGPRVFVGPQCSLDRGVQLEADVRLVARVTLGRDVRIGARTVIQPGAVIGGDGFGFAPDRHGWVKVPQVGSVRVGPDVEIGANTTIDRGAIDDTVIEEGVKLDNLIQIGHNVRIGAHTVIAGCTGISGSTTIGRRCMIGGAVNVNGHINIADDVSITGASSVTRSIASAGVYSSTLTVEEAHAWWRLMARFKRSAALGARLRRLERAAGLKSAPDDEAPDDQHE